MHVTGSVASGQAARGMYGRAGELPALDDLAALTPVDPLQRMARSKPLLHVLEYHLSTLRLCMPEGLSG